MRASEIKIKAKEISTLEEGNIIVGNKEVEATIENELQIFANKISYNKTEGKLVAEGDVRSVDLKNQNKINSQKAIYFKKKIKSLLLGKLFWNKE